MTIDVLRRKSATEEPHWESWPFEPRDRSETVATALTRLNETMDDPIRWECSCLQKKCGACAMVINGVPKLACDTFLRDYKKLRLEPLRKFPVVADLIVDRGVMRENLRALRLWFEGAVGDGDLIVGSSIEVPSNHKLVFYNNSYNVVAQLDKTGTGLDTAVYANMNTIREMLDASTKQGFHYYDGDPKRAISSVMVKVAEGCGIAAAALVVFPFSGLIKQSLDLPYLLPNTGVIASLLIGSALLSLLAGALTSGLSARRLTKSETGLILREDA